LRVFSGAALLLGIGALTGVPAHAAAPANVSASSSSTPAKGELDCNGFSTVQKELRANLCTDISGAIKGAWGGKFYDNGHYIGHDEPDTTFLSNARGSGGNVTWTETLGSDPSGTPGNSHPGSDLSKWFELSPAPWFSMALCDPNSFPGTACTPNSDSNAPTCAGVNCGPTTQGGGSAFMEMQLYPPGNPPFVDSESCDATHWCAALNIDSLTATPTTNPNPKCVEPVNFAFIQKDGTPTGPPSPQSANLNTFVPNGNTLLMNPGDRISVHMSDAPASGGHAFEVVINDLTTHQTGFMQASAANGFQTTSALGGARDEHQHRVRDRSLRGVHLGHRRDRPQPLRRERHGRDIQPVQRPVREQHHHGQHRHQRRDQRRAVLRPRRYPSEL
jgi:hypothetical protein